MKYKRWKTSDEFPGGMSIPFGIKVSQTWHEVGQILRIINDYNIKIFVEVGCHVGGLASIVVCRKLYFPEFSYVGIEKSDVVDDIIEKSCNIRKEDAFIDSKNVIKNMGTRRKFVYCDNGNKIEEMKLFSTCLNIGDIIACHDYFDNQDVIGLDGWGVSDDCGCKPEVWREDIAYLYDDPSFVALPDYLLEGTRIAGFIKR